MPDSESIKLQSSKSSDQIKPISAHNVSPILHPLPLLDLPSRPKLSLKTVSSNENLRNQVTTNFPTADDVKTSKNISNLNITLTTDKSPVVPKQATDLRENPSLRKKKSIERPPFAPFFTLINTGETTAYPRQVHYLFSDDDTSEELTSALLRSLLEETPSCTSLIASADLECSYSKNKLELSDIISQTTGVPRHDAGKGKNREFNGKGNKTEREERVVIVDLNSTGDGVAGVSSLCSNWQVINAQIEKAPTWNGAEEVNASGNDDVLENKMLKIEGVTNTEYGTDITTPMDKISGKEPENIGWGTLEEPNKVPSEEEMQNLLEKFDHKMEILRRVTGTYSRLDSKNNVVETS